MFSRIFISLVALFSLTDRAYAKLEEPLELMILTRVDGRNFPVGLCPGNPLPDHIFGAHFTSATTVFDETMNLLANANAAAAAAAAIYDLPDLESVSHGADLVSKTPAFLQAIPRGYQFYSYFSEPEAGMKYMLLKPENDDPNRPYILAIAGTQSMMDWIVDADLGRAQLMKFSRILRMFTACQYLDSHGQPLASHGLIVTGHSLGGGLAQAIGYKIQSVRGRAGLAYMAMSVLSFNAFGARELIAKDEAYDPRLAITMRARNHFVEGDLISRIGTHIGPTYPLRWPEDMTKCEGVVSCHSMSSVLKFVNLIAKKTVWPLASRESASPPSLGLLGKLVNYGSILRRLPDFIYHHREDKIIQLFSQATEAIERLDLSDPVNRESARYVSRLIFAREMSLREQGQNAEALKRLRLRLNSYIK